MYIRTKSIYIVYALLFINKLIIFNNNNNIRLVHVALLLYSSTLNLEIGKCQFDIGFGYFNKKIVRGQLITGGFWVCS